MEYRGEAYLGLNRVDDAKQAYLELFASDRKQADILMKAMSDWVAKRRVDAAGADPASVSALESWIKERSALARPDGEHGARRAARHLAIAPRARPCPMPNADGHHPASDDRCGAADDRHLALDSLRGNATAFPWNLPRGLPTPKVPADNPITQAEGRSRAAAFLRLTAFGQQALFVRELSSAGAGLYRRARARARLDRRRASAEHDEPCERRL